MWAVTYCFLVWVMTFVCILRAEYIPSPSATSHKAHMEIYNPSYDLPSVVEVNVQKFESSDALHLTSLDNDGEEIKNNAQHSQHTSITPVIDDSEIVADALEEMVPKANIIDANDAVTIDMVEVNVEKFESSDALHLTSLDNDGEEIENNAQHSQHTSISAVIDDSEILADAVEETVPKEANDSQRSDTNLTLWNERASDISGVKSAVIVWEIDDNFDGKSEDEIDEMDYRPNKTHNLEYQPDARMKRSVDLETLLEIERLYRNVRDDDALYGSGSGSGEGSGESTTIFFTDSTIEFETTSSIGEETSTVIETSTSAKPTSPSSLTPTSPSSPTPSSARPTSPQPTSSALPPTTGPPVTESGNLGNATINITLTLKFTGSFSDVRNDSSATYQQIKQHCEATLTAAYESTAGYDYVRVTSFSDGASRQKRSAVTTSDGIIAEYDVFYVMQSVSESYADVTELIKDIREVVLPLLNNSTIGNETVDGAYLRDSVESELADKERELEYAFGNVCNFEGVCSPCYKCSVNGTKVWCGFRCDFYNANKNCSLDDNGIFKECVCRIDYLPVVTSCVHKDLIIGVSVGVGAVILLAFISLLVYCARKNSFKSSFSLHEFDDLSVGQDNAPNDSSISQDNLSSQASDNGGNSLSDRSARGASSVVANHSDGDALGHSSSSGSLGRDNAAYTVDVPELQFDTDIVRRGRLRHSPPFNESIQLNTIYSSASFNGIETIEMPRMYEPQDHYESSQHI